MNENSVKKTNLSFLNNQASTFQQEKMNSLYVNPSLPIHYNPYPSSFQNNSSYIAHNSNNLNQMSGINTNNIQATNYQAGFSQVQASNYNYQYGFNSYHVAPANKTFTENQTCTNSQLNVIPTLTEESDTDAEFLRSK